PHSSADQLKSKDSRCRSRPHCVSEIAGGSESNAGKADVPLDQARGPQTMESNEHARCPVHANFDPLSTAFLADPFAVLRSLPGDPQVFYAPSIHYYVVTRYADIEAVFLDPETSSAATAQLPLTQLVPEAVQILLGGGHKPEPSMVSLDPPAHTRLRSPTARAFTPRRIAQMEPKIRRTVDQLLNAVDPLASFDLVS